MLVGLAWAVSLKRREEGRGFAAGDVCLAPGCVFVRCRWLARARRAAGAAVRAPAEVQGRPANDENRLAGAARRVAIYTG